MKIHICTENPCKLLDEECTRIIDNGFEAQYIGLNDPVTHEPLYVDNKNGSKIGTFIDVIIK